jgi:hypothetical protein
MISTTENYTILAKRLLVLCLTGVLYTVLLYALRLGLPNDTQILIEHNLVVYCASLTSSV